MDIKKELSDTLSRIDADIARALCLAEEWEIYEGNILRDLEELRDLRITQVFRGGTSSE